MISDLETHRPHLIDLIKSSQWPEAIASSLIVKTLEQRQLRAQSILTNFIKKPLNHVRFLDFGCGHGDCVHQAVERGALAAGYDIEANTCWQEQKGEYSTDIDRITGLGPYDIILLYDVMDHIMDGTFKMIELLKTMMTNDSIVYVRCHPYSSRHGGHLYEQLNKAYLHLFMSPLELQQLNITMPAIRQIITPSETYLAIFKECGLTIINTDISYVAPESVIELVMPFIINKWQKFGITDLTQILSIMSIQFIDYQVQNSKCRGN